MTMTKFLLLAATAAAACGSAAQAQFVFPAATLDGAGATLPATAERQAFDCYGAKSVLAFTGVASSSNPVSIFDFNFPGTGTPVTTFDCASRVVQPNVGTRFIGTGSGGLKLTRVQYCAILNGTITNWNQLPANVVTKDPADAAAFNVPIVLAGRSESSGTTGLLTRALAAQCAGSDYVNSTTTLPAARVSGAVFAKGTSPTFTGTEVVGKFTVANGNDGVAQLVAYHPDPAGAAGTRTQNGRIGYNGPDFTLPAVLFTGANTYGLNTASLQVNGTGTVYVGPTAKDAAAAFVGIAPPQSKGAAGAYCSAATGCLAAGGSAANSDGTRKAGDRAVQLNWVFPANKFLTDDAGNVTTAANPLAAPTKGYPIMGTSNVNLYTCYADPATRRAIDGVWATFVGKTTLDSTGTTAASKIPVKLLTDPVKGVLAKNGLAAMPAAWTAAIAETFLKSSTQVGTVGQPTTKLGLRNLWIQNKIAALATDNLETKVFGNPSCTGKPGA